jgi:hypothetical protein
VRSGGRVGGVRSGGADVGRQRDAQGLEQLAGTTGDGGAQDEALAVRRDLDLLETIEVAPALVSVTLKDGRRISVPLWWLPRLARATAERRASGRIMPFGDAIEWPDIDEHVGVKGLLRGRPAPGAKPTGDAA